MLAVQDKFSPVNTFFNTLLSGLFSVTIISWRAVSQMYWKLFSSRLSLFNSAPLAFHFITYNERGQVQLTQQSEIPTFQAVLALVWNRA